MLSSRSKPVLGRLKKLRKSSIRGGGLDDNLQSFSEMPLNVSDTLFCCDLL